MSPRTWFLTPALCLALGCPNPRSAPEPRAANDMVKTARVGGGMQTPAREALDRHLKQRQPGVAFDISPLDAHAPGYAFFEGQQEDAHDGGLQYWVVRGDTVVGGDPQGEMGRICRALGVVERPGEQSADNLARIALALYERDKRVVDSESHSRFAAMYGPGALDPPRLERSGEGARLVFWGVTVGRGMSFTRFELAVSGDYQVTTKREHPTLRRKGE